MAPVSPEWQPGSAHALAYVTTTAAVSIVNTDTGEILARWHDRNPARQLSWSADGKLLLVVGSGSIDVLTATLRGVEARRFQAGRVVAASWAPHGTRYALISYGAHDNRTAVTVEPILRRGGLAHTVFVGTGHIDGANLNALLGVAHRLSELTYPPGQTP